ncbi:hypothetical protein [Stappia sp.]|uniref:hypothetical protein n=1 Tax=Stappia sp. TaxID=1870903 RepID=UPI003A99F530
MGQVSVLKDRDRSEPIQMPQDGQTGDNMAAIICSDSIVAQDLGDLVQAHLGARVAIFGDAGAGACFVRDSPGVNLMLLYMSRQEMDETTLFACDAQKCHVILIAHRAPDGWIERGAGRHHFIHEPFNERMLQRALEEVRTDLDAAARPSSR